MQSKQARKQGNSFVLLVVQVVQANDEICHEMEVGTWFMKCEQFFGLCSASNDIVSVIQSIKLLLQFKLWHCLLGELKC